MRTNGWRCQATRNDQGWQFSRWIGTSKGVKKRALFAPKKDPKNSEKGRALKFPNQTENYQSRLSCNCKSKNKNIKQCTNQPSGYLGFAQDLIPAPKLKHFGKQEKWQLWQQNAVHIFSTMWLLPMSLMTSRERPTLGCARFFTVGICLRLILRELPGGESSLALCTSFTQLSIWQHGTIGLKVQRRLTPTKQKSIFVHCMN